MLAEMMIAGCLVTSYYVVPVDSHLGDEYDDHDYVEFIKANGDFVKACATKGFDAAKSGFERASQHERFKEELMKKASQKVEAYLAENAQNIAVGTAAGTAAGAAAHLLKGTGLGGFALAFIGAMIKSVIDSVTKELKDEGSSKEEFEARVLAKAEEKMEEKMQAVYAKLDEYKQLLDAKEKIDPKAAVLAAKKQELEQKAKADAYSSSHDYRPDRPWGRDSDYGPYRGEYKTGPNHEFNTKMGESWKPSPTPPNLVERRDD